MLLLKSNSTLVSEIATQTLTNKTIGVGQLTCNTRAYTGDGSTVVYSNKRSNSTKCFGVYQWCFKERQRILQSQEQH